MIYSLKLLQQPEHHFNYLTDLTRNVQVAKLYHKLEDGIEFKPGLNYIVGENGSGKSTILNIIRCMNLCEHSFIPQQEHLRITTIENLNNAFESFELKEDYRYTIFNLYRMFEDKDKIGSQTALDTLDDAKLFLAGKEESKGQNVMGDIHQLFNWMFERQEECFPMWKYVQDIHKQGDFKEDPEPSDNGLIIRSPNTNSTKLMKAIERDLVKCEPPMFTILMDEPDQGLDIKNLNSIYDVIGYDKPDTQLIAVIHNPLLIYKLHREHPDANWIEMSEGYIESVKKEVKDFYSWIDPTWCTNKDDLGGKLERKDQ